MKLQTVQKQKGASMVEYAIVAALIAAVAVTALTNVGTTIASKFSSIATTLR